VFFFFFLHKTHYWAKMRIVLMVYDLFNDNTHQHIVVKYS